MFRVSNTLNSFSVKNNIMNLESKLYKVNNQISTGKEIQYASESPDITGLSIDLRKSIKMISQYQRNIDYVSGFMDYTDSALNDITQILQRVRELAVQAANGTLAQEDREAISKEVDQLLKRLYNISNEKYNGRSIFSGYEVLRYAFIKNQDSSEITGIYYAGDDGEFKVKIGNSEEMTFNIPGNKLFYSENETIISRNNLNNFVAQQDYTIKINGININIYQGDTIFDIANRINKANTGVNVNIDPDTGDLTFTTVYPHKPFLEDVNGNLLEQMGIIIDSEKPPFNINPSADHFGGSLFDQLINFRNALKNNDIETIGTRTIQFIDFSLNNINKYRAELGAKRERLNIAYKYLETQKMNLTKELANNEDSDLTEKISELKKIELMHQAALQVSTRLNNITLLNFLR